MVQIAGGCFQMGSPESEAGRESDERQHRVCVKDFALGRHEVTVGEFERFVAVTNYRTDAEKSAAGGVSCYAWNATDGKWGWRAGLSWRKPGYAQEDTYPVVCVSWNDANRYAEWLTKETGQTYRLPTEAEWEYAARAGTTTARYWGENPNQACRYGNVVDQTKSSTGAVWGPPRHECSDGYWYSAPVGSFQPNAWKLYDMLGNVWEWTCSAYDKNYGGVELKCSNKDTGGPLAVRGGSWFYGPAVVRSAARGGDDPIFRYDHRGFRLARSL
ncbi:MAG TPA: formylglycine-generating enzyme family protein [Candidatus Competibacter sp.]|jgi:formylglycine-generating enzyme required for sulfatase activity|nr:formylglycine-generating enzyme family protein [Candidatus Competibacter sp.]